MRKPSPHTRTAEALANPELFSVEPCALAADVRAALCELDITSCPIVGDDGQLVGLATLRSLASAPDDAPVEDFACDDGITVPRDASVEQIAELMGETYSHQVVVVDAKGRVVGLVSAIDVIREMCDLPPRRPDRFPHYDKEFDVRWTDQVPFEYSRTRCAPNAAGILSLVTTDDSSTDHVVWSEYTNNLRARLVDLLAEPTHEDQPLSTLLEAGDLRFKMATLNDEPRGREIVNALQRLSGHAHGA